MSEQEGKRRVLAQPLLSVEELSARNEDGAAPDLIGLRVHTRVVGENGIDPLPDPLGTLYTFGRGVFDVRVWVPDQADHEVAKTVIPHGGADLAVYAFSKDPINHKGVPLSSFRGRRGEELDVVAWHQMCRVSDQPRPIMLTRYGFVSRVDDERVVVVRTTRDDAMSVKASSEVAKRVEGRS